MRGSGDCMPACLPIPPFEPFRAFNLETTGHSAVHCPLWVDILAEKLRFFSVILKINFLLFVMCISNFAKLFLFYILFFVIIGWY